MSQLTINYYQGVGYEGMIADTNPRVIRGALEQFVADEYIPYGSGVRRLSATSNRLRLPSATGQKIIGIAITTDMYGYPEPGFVDGSIRPGYEAGTLINVLTWGDIIIYSAQPVNVDDPVYINYAQSGTDPQDRPGRFRKTNVAAQTDLLPNARFLTTTTVAGLAFVNIGGA
jgi:hypothetical protein